MGADRDEDTRIAILVSSLSELKKYFPMITSMHMLQTARVTWNLITAMRLEECKRFSSPRESEEESQPLERTSLALLHNTEKELPRPNERNRGSGTQCYECNETVHVVFECPAQRESTSRNRSFREKKDRTKEEVIIEKGY